MISIFRKISAKLSRRVRRTSILLIASFTCMVSFQNCGKVRITDSGVTDLSSLLTAQDRSTDVEFKEVMVPVDVNTSKTVTFIDKMPFAGVVSLDQTAILLSSSFAAQGKVAIDPLNPGKITFDPEFGYRGALAIPIYIKYNDGKIQIVKLTFEVQNPLRDFKPAMVVRAAECMLCHAKIQGDLISDFGHKGAMDPNGPDLFQKKNTVAGGSLSTAYGVSHDPGDPNVSGWMTVNLNGRLIFPKSDLPDPVADPTRIYVKSRDYVAAGISKVAATLGEYLNNVVFNSAYRPAPTGDEVFAKPTLEERSDIYIGALTEDEIRTAGKLSDDEKIKFVKNDADKPGLSGFARVTANGKDFYTNTGDMICDGDLFVDGVVFLKNLRLSTQLGCRIHATKTVFINGLIEYLEEYALSNLEVMSARAIYLGMGMCYDCYPDNYNTNFAVSRSGNMHYWANSFRGRRDLSGYANDIYQDFLKVSNDGNIPRPPAGTADVAAYYKAEWVKQGVTLTDANNPFDNTSTTPFRRILLNAPDVQSRYNGKFQGTVIAEMALWKLGGQFAFQYDSVFTAVPIFPLVDLKKILQIGPKTSP